MKPILKPILLCGIVMLTFLSNTYSQKPPTEREIKRAEAISKKVPADFNPDKHILLFLEMPKRNSNERSESITNKLNKAIKSSWPYKYEIVSPQDIFDANSKFSDTSIYKFAVLHSLSSYRHENIVGDPSSGGVTVNSIDFCFYDRVTKQKYPYSGNSSSFLGMTTKGFIKMIKEGKGIKD